MNIAMPLGATKLTNHQASCYACGQAILGKPVVVSGANFTLYKNDFRELGRVLADNSVHAVITDPPYGSGGFTIKDKRRYKLLD
jgi:hypothetical protein